MLPKDRHQKAQWLLQWLDLVRMASDDTYFLEYAVERFLKWTGHQLRGELGEASPDDSRSPEEIAVTLNTARRVFQSGLDHTDAYRLILERNHR